MGGCDFSWCRAITPLPGILTALWPVTGHAGPLRDSVKGLWPTEDDLGFQYIVYLLGEAVNTLTGIGEGRSTTLSTIALTSTGSIFIALAGLYIAVRTFKAVFEGAHQKWIWEARSSYGLLGMVIGFLLVIPIPAINGYTLAHTIPIYTAVTGIGIANLATGRILAAYGQHPLVALSMKKFIDPVAYQSALTMLNAQVCMRVLNEAEGVRLHRSLETLEREDTDLRGSPGVLPGLPPNPGIHQYEAFVQAAAAQYGVPPALIHAVIQAESGYRPRAVSEAGAIGLMQLMPATATRWGVSDPWDPYQNILGGTRYLAWLLNRYDGRMELAAAAYNAGEGAVDGCRCIPNNGETNLYVPRVLANYNRNLAQGVPGGVAGTLHVRRVMWGGSPYAKNLCGELEYPVAYTLTQADTVGPLQDRLLSARDVAMQTLEERMALIAAELVGGQGELSQEAMAQALLRAIMDFDFNLHRTAMETFDHYAQPAMDAFVEGVKVEGWTTLGEYFMKLAELQEATAAASRGIEPKTVAYPEAYLTQKVGRLLKGHLARVEALLHRANDGLTESERIAIAKEIARQNGIAQLDKEVNEYIKAHPMDAMMNEQLLGDHTFVQQEAPRYEEFRRSQVARAGKGGLPQAMLEGLLQFLVAGSDRFPLLKYQEIGQWILVGGTATGIVSTFVPDRFAGAVGAIATLLLTLGFLLAIVLPLLPLLVWYIAVLGWYLNFLVALIAAPVWGLFHVNAPRAKPGYFVLLRLLLYPAFLVMSLVVVAGLLVVADAIIDKIIVTSLIKLSRSEEYVLALGAFLLYAIVLIATVVFVTRLMVIMVEKFFYLVSVEAAPVVRINAGEVIARFRKPV